jgi:peroxiredoxin
MKNLIIILLLLFATSGVKSQEIKSVEQANGLSTGQKAPVFSALDADSTTFQLQKALENGPVVLIFYRGFWCPVCNKHLGSLQDSLRLIEETGAKVIAVSPEKPEFLDKMAQKTGAQFTLLYDEGYRIAKAYDVAYRPTRAKLFTYNVVLGGKLKKTHSDASQQLPIPATFIISRNGIIVWRQFNRDYKKRASVKEIVDALKENKKMSSTL